MKNSIALWTKKWAVLRDVPFRFYAETTSTNDKAKELSFSTPGQSYCLFIAESQTRGRGRGGKAWFNSDMMLSWSMPLLQAPQPITSVLMGEVLIKALLAGWPEVPLRLKKPNDIYVGQKKMAGILVEALSKGDLHCLVVGVGMNVWSCPTHKSFATLTTSLSQHISPQDLTTSKWFLFLDNWQEQLKTVIF